MNSWRYRTRDPEPGLVVIKASGILYEEMHPERMVVIDIDGNRVEGNYKPSSDIFGHLYIYKHRAAVGVVHTHSRYAPAFATVGISILCVLTAIADEFSGPIFCGGFAFIGHDAIGKVVVYSRSVKSAPGAVKAAVMTEVAATVWMASFSARHMMHQEFDLS